MLQHVEFGRTGLRVSRIALGTWQFGGSWGQVHRRDAVAAVDAALERGITLFDTAHAYGWGAAEEVLGRALADNSTVDRDEVVIATKGGVRRGETGNIRDLTPAFLRSGLETSLRALDVEHVDIFLLHWPDGQTPLDAVAGQLRDFLDAGKIRHVGVSNFDVAQLRELEDYLDVAVFQPPYNLLRRGVETEVLPYCRARSLGVFVYGALAHGLLTGRFEPGASFEPSDWRSKSPVFRGEAFTRNAEVAQQLVSFADELGATPTQVAIAWTLHQPGVHSTIVGGRGVAQISEAARAVELNLTEEHLARIEAIAAGGVPIGGPSPEGGVDE